MIWYVCLESVYLKTSRLPRIFWSNWWIIIYLPKSLWMIKALDTLTESSVRWRLPLVQLWAWFWSSGSWCQLWTNSPTWSSSPDSSEVLRIMSSSVRVSKINIWLWTERICLVQLFPSKVYYNNTFGNIAIEARVAHKMVR